MDRERNNNKIPMEITITFPLLILTNMRPTVICYLKKDQYKRTYIYRYHISIDSLTIGETYSFTYTCTSFRHNFLSLYFPKRDEPPTSGSQLHEKILRLQNESSLTEKSALQKRNGKKRHKSVYPPKILALLRRNKKHGLTCRTLIASLSGSSCLSLSLSLSRESSSSQPATEKLSPALPRKV